MTGTFVAIVGPSGAGKDSVMSYAGEKLGADLVIVRRVVTRTADGGSEDHDSMSRQAFEEAERAGRFAVNWEAHGLRYGLPVELEQHLDAGRVVMANLSRAVLPQVMHLYPGALVLEVVAEPEIISARLLERGREDEAEIRRRLARGAGFRLPPGTVRIDNSGPLERAGDEVVALLRALLRQPA